MKQTGLTIKDRAHERERAAAAMTYEVRNGRLPQADYMFEMFDPQEDAGLRRRPVCHYLYRDTAQYLTSFPEYARIYGAPGLERDGVHLRGEGGAAVWVPPGDHTDEAATSAFTSSTRRTDGTPECSTRRRLAH
jgi:hypothetical protein